MEIETLLDYRTLTLGNIAKAVSLNVEDILNAACEGHIQVGISSISWGLCQATKEQALFRRACVAIKSSKIPAAYKRTFGKASARPSAQLFINESFALMKEDLVTLRDTGKVKIYYVSSFDQEKYFYILRRDHQDTRYRYDQNDAGLLLTYKDISTLITTKEEKNKLFEILLNDQFSKSESNTQRAEVKASEIAAVLADLASTLAPNKYRTASGPNIDAISKDATALFEQRCKENNSQVPYGFSVSTLEKTIHKGRDSLQEKLEEEKGQSKK